jgi:hypothetical protein
VAPLASVIEHAQAARRETAVRRGELVLRSRESRLGTSRLAAGLRTATRQLERAKTNNELLPAWPAWAPPDADLIRTLVSVD